jgi:hypothetical protein
MIDRLVSQRSLEKERGPMQEHQDQAQLWWWLVRSLMMQSWSDGDSSRRRPAGRMKLQALAPLFSFRRHDLSAIEHDATAHLDLAFVRAGERRDGCLSG